MSRRRLTLSMLASASLAASGVSGPASAQGFQVEIVRDAETETLLRNFANPLFRAAGVDPNLVRIILVRDDAINSFVSTGNRMFINTGVITKADTADELIGVIAHETGHIRGGHLARLPEAMQAAMLEGLAATLFGAGAAIAGSTGGQSRPRSPYGSDNSATSAGIGAALGGQQMAMRNFLSFSRIIEASADQGALEFLDRTHWSARGLLAMFHRLEDQTLLPRELQDPYVQTHPLTQTRIAKVAEFVAHSPYSDAKLPPEFERGFQLVKAKLAAFLTPSSITLQRVKASDPSPPARYARAIALYRLGHTDEGLALLDGLLADQPTSPWLYELKGQVLFGAGRVRQSLTPYREAARLAPEQGQIRSALGHAMVEADDPLLLKPAIAELQIAVAREYDDTDSWHALSVAWGKLGDLGQANLALAEEALLNDDIRAAKSWAAQAEKQLPPGPSRMRAADITNAVKRENRKGF